jgi:hypothetical protein
MSDRVGGAGRIVGYGLKIGERPYYKTQKRRWMVNYLFPGRGDRGSETKGHEVLLSVGTEPPPRSESYTSDEHFIHLTPGEAFELGMQLLNASRPRCWKEIESHNYCFLPAGHAGKCK